ncbi:helix-turn-helix transcriptional regulator [Methylobacterium oxalidis]|uniref:HTH luxR-type domain-containing protein n=1 Tax=Methylobacterium oxalidis TaxID=944322 RepID=A0A512JBQ7_9HYPH|nr:response regulator transcription factor [Methylobacterium oxalidis]GEP07402.1 hypothetical protein MOX02_54400 [Methylobacterium oxalidis]GLS67652.1 hypothetical protein GCM10007888_60370 [Methylobacterium oxalidis]
MAYFIAQMDQNFPFEGAKMSYIVVPTVVVAASSFTREGIRSYLSGSRFDVLNIDQTQGPENANNIALIITTPKDLEESPAIASILSSNPSVKTFLLCPIEAAKCLKLETVRSVAGIIDCEIDGKTLINALDLVMDGVRVHSAKIMEFVLDQPMYFGNLISVEAPSGKREGEGWAPERDLSKARSLSPSELKVLKCLAGGSSNKAIALQHCLAEATVKIHVKNILRKLSAQNRTQAAIWARENGVHFA